jgi:hypothetical protein
VLLAEFELPGAGVFELLGAGVFELLGAGVFELLSRLLGSIQGELDELSLNLAARDWTAGEPNKI